MHNLIKGAFTRPGAIVFMLIIILAVGYNAIVTIPKEANPDVEIPVAYSSCAILAYHHLMRKSYC